MGLLDFLKVKKTTPIDRTLKTEDFRAVGVNYYESNIKKLAVSNPDWKKTYKALSNEDKTGKKYFGMIILTNQ